jgi:hypothetical protein
VSTSGLTVSPTPQGKYLVFWCQNGLVRFEMFRKSRARNKVVIPACPICSSIDESQVLSGMHHGLIDASEREGGREKEKERVTELHRLGATTVWELHRLWSCSGRQTWTQSYQEGLSAVMGLHLGGDAETLADVLRCARLCVSIRETPRNRAEWVASVALRSHTIPGPDRAIR